MKNDIKLFFVDLDGTLLDDRRNGIKAISPTNKYALEKAKKEGVEIVISTGRIGHKAIHWFKESELDYAIFGNGSQVIDKDLNIIRELKIESDEMKKIVNFCKKYDLALKIDDVRIAYGVANEIHELMADELGYKKIEDHFKAPTDESIKLVIWGQKIERMQELRKIMKKEIPTISVASAERGRTLEVTNKQATKGRGNKFVMEMLNIDKKYTAHIGDTMNDFSAIKYVDKFIAMRDGAIELLKEAEYIGPNHFDNGVAKVLAGEFQKNPFKK